ncbi:MAG: hypothetical protein IT336_08810 [Thermomicrobiales bacterium]|nr:hypothetical protein [Thermomicrobiales bacterium]
MSDEVNAPEAARRVTVKPEPSADEAEAIAAAIAIYLSGRVEGPSIEVAPPASRWQAAGRRAARRGLGSGSDRGWGRPAAGWTRDRRG